MRAQSRNLGNHFHPPFSKRLAFFSDRKRHKKIFWCLAFSIGVSGVVERRVSFSQRRLALSATTDEKICTIQIPNFIAEKNWLG
jgi:hypothetical protein